MSSALKVCPQCGTEYPANARFCEVDGTALRSSAASEDLVGSIVADRYHVMKKLGEGGMGQVYLVEHVKMGRKSALKVMHPGMVKDVDAISRFNREAANASRINHPNVASVYDFGETPEGIIYLAMELVDGPALTAVIEQHGALPAKRAAEIVRQTGEALAVAHDMGIVHRDLKPDNIMLAKTREGADLVKVVDFGIAKAAGNDAQKVTKTGLVVGTPEYMSPEQLAGDKLDGKSDIYSLGLVAFNMLTGTLPFPSDSAQESMIMRLTDRPKTLHDMRPEVSWPPDVQAVMDKALERDASLRYQTAAEFGRDLVKAIDRMPETVAAELGTQVMGAAAVPATRVASPAASAPGMGSVAPGMPGAMRTIAVPVPAPGGVAENRNVVAHDTAAGKKSPMVPVAAGLVVVLALGAGGYFMLNGKTKAADTTGSKPAAITSGAAVPNPGAGASQAVTTLPLVTDSAKGPTKKTPSSSTAPNPTAGGSNAVVFDRLDKLAADSVTAKDALTGLASVQVTTDDDRVRAALVKFTAKLQLGQPDCTILKDVAAIAPKTTKRAKFDQNMTGFCAD